MVQIWSKSKHPAVRLLLDLRSIGCCVVWEIYRILFQRGYKILKISEFPIRTIVRKVLHVYDDSPIHTDVSLGEGDTLAHVMWTRVWMER